MMSLADEPKGTPDQRCAELERQLDKVRAERDELVRLNSIMNRERVEYLQNVSHQLVAPLHAIKWHIENLTHGRIKTSERAAKVFRSIYSQATIAVHLAKNFVFMSSLEADHSLSSLREPLEPLELDRLLVNLADDFQPLGWNKNINIHVNVESFDQVPDVLAIKPLISQVFSNIIENAIKYSNGDTTVEIGGSYMPKDDAVTVSIITQSVPLSPEDAERIFERGFRTVLAADAYPAGTGFGLYIARKIVEIHEGLIRVVVPKAGVADFQVVLYPRKLQGKSHEWPKRRSS